MTMRADGKPKFRPGARHRPNDEAASADAKADALVKAAYLELAAAGVYPSVNRLTRRLKMSKWTVDNARSRLIEAGSLPCTASLPYASMMGLDVDPLAERPDDPDATEIQARIAEVRAEKETSGRARPPMEVARGRFHHPSRRVGSHQRVMA